MRRPPVVPVAAAPRSAAAAPAEDVARFDHPAGCGRTYGHNGSFASYLSYARVSEDGGSAAVLLLNGHGPTTEARGDEVIAALSCGGAAAASSRPETHAA